MGDVVENLRFFSIPIMLRIYFKYDRSLPTQLCHCASESLQIFFRRALSLDEGMLGGTFYCLPQDRT